MKKTEAKKRLEYLRGEIQAERISYGEIVELQSLVGFIEPGDTLLLEWAGVPEFPRRESKGADTTTQHTPGPWRIKSNDIVGAGAGYPDEGCTGPAICMMHNDASRPSEYMGDEMRIANARLIAAAPDLLAALDCIARGLTNGQKERGETFQSIARAAVAKAKGKI